MDSSVLHTNEAQPSFFDFAAEVGLTKHIGGIEATDLLVELCHIDEHKYVLDVGCGAGVTPVYIAKKYGSRVVGVDILPMMVERSMERANKEQVTDRTEFRVADAQDLPFDDDTFDAVITESVTAFPEDKQRAVNEYARVTKPGGYVGLNESTWLKVPPPPDVLEWVSQDVGFTVKPQTQEAWVGLLEGAGMEEIVVKIYNVDVKDETKGIVQRYGLGGMLKVQLRILRLYLRSSAYRDFLKGVRQRGLTPANLNEYFGYGIFVGRK